MTGTISIPVIMKEALKLLGIDVGDCFKPVGRISDDNRKKLKEILVNMKLID